MKFRLWQLAESAFIIAIIVHVAFATRRCSNPPYVPCGICYNARDDSVISTGEFSRSVQIFNPGDTVYYHSSSPDWILEEPTVVECQSNGEWSKKPVCLRPYCFPFPEFANGQCTSSEPDKGVRQTQRARCDCNPGFSRWGFSRVTCLNATTNRWGRTPTCRESRGCSRAPRIRRGKCVRIEEPPPGYTKYMLLGSSVSCTCNPGYAFRTESTPTNPADLLTKATFRGHTYSSEWISVATKGRCVVRNRYADLPRCVKLPLITTTAAPTTTTAAPTTTTKRVTKPIGGPSTERRCANPPYVRCGVCVSRDPTTRSSQRNREIPDALTVRRYSRRIMVFDVGRTVYYQPKNDRWTFEGNIAVTCQADGTWSDPPTCQRPFCSGLPKIDNGTCSSDDPSGRVRLTSRAICQCNEGFTLRGFSRVACRGLPAEGSQVSEWGRKPECIPTELPGCSRSPRIRSGRCRRLLAPAFPFQLYMKSGDYAQCVCRPGFGIKAMNAKTLSTDLDQPPLIYRNNNYSPRFLKYTTASHCTGNDKFNFLPKCVRLPPLDKNCSAPPEVPGAGCEDCIDYENLHYDFLPGDTVRYHCRGNYEMSGNPVVLCRKDGTWSPAPVCTEMFNPRTCKNIPIPKNGYCQAEIEGLGEDEVYAGTAVECRCEEGHEMQGDPEILCLSNGTWSSTGPLCNFVITTKKPTCSLDTIITEIGNASCESETSDGAAELYQGEKALCFCDDGYVLEGSQEVTCTGNGGWSSNRPRCRLVGNCGDLPDVENGFCWSDDYFGTSFNETQTVNCQCDGDSSSNVQNVPCGRDGSWGTTPVCDGPETVYDCPPVNLPKATCGNNEAGYSAGTVVICYCDGDGASSRHYCRSNGNWRSRGTTNCP